MKRFLTAAWTIICLAVLFYGHSYWKERTAVGTASPKQQAAPVIHETKKANQPNYNALLAKAQNWPEPARQQFQQALKQNQPFKILFVGSTALGSQDQGMLKNVIQQLNTAYGTNHITTVVHTYNVTSKQFVANNDQQEIAAEKAQLIVFEPFLLNDNGFISIGDSLNNLTKVITDVKAANPNTTFILQPSYPLFDAVHYPVQVAKLKQYAEQNQIPYLDHWTAWPDYHSQALNKYVLSNASGPTDLGNQVWSQYLINYLIHS